MYQNLDSLYSRARGAAPAILSLQRIVPAVVRPQHMSTTIARSWTARACVPNGRGEVLLALHPKTIEVMANNQRRAALGQGFGLIVQDEILLAPTAAFRGVLRPMNYPGHDDDIVAYATRVGYTYTFSDNGRLQRYAPPRECVFVAFVSFAAVLSDLGQNPASVGAVGGVLDWEWTQAGAGSPHLPVDYQTRYRSTLWVR